MDRFSKRHPRDEISDSGPLNIDNTVVVEAPSSYKYTNMNSTFEP